MPLVAFQRGFARRMLPLCVLAALSVAILPPLSYGHMAREQLRRQAEIYARLLAHDLGRSAVESPLWKYRTDKILLSTERHRFQRDIAFVFIRDCAGRVVADSEALGIGTGRTGGESAGAFIRDSSGRVGSVEVVLDPASHRTILRLLTTASVLFGLLLGAVLYLYPARVVGRQAAALARAQRQLRMLDVQEEERRRIARELHDGVGQALTALQIELARAQKGDPEPVARAGVLAEEALDEIRTAVHALRPLSLEQQDLETALRTLLERFELRSGIRASVRITGSLNRVSPSRAQVVYRILQEALTNTAKHAHATEVGAVFAVEKKRAGVFHTGQRLRI